MQASESMIAVASGTAVLVIWMWLCGTITTYVRGKAMESPNREDGPVMNFFNRIFGISTGDLTVLPDNSEKDVLVNRWIRIGDNNTANIPAALIVFFIAALYDT